MPDPRRAERGSSRDGQAAVPRYENGVLERLRGSQPPGNSRRWIVRAVEDSLRRLGTDWIDLYQIHRPDPHADVDETLGVLTDLVRQGKVRYVGSSISPRSRSSRPSGSPASGASSAS